MEITFQQTNKSLFELLIGKSIADGIQGTVGIAKEVGEHIHMTIDARGAKAGYYCEYMIRCPAQNKRTHYY